MANPLVFIGAGMALTGVIQAVKSRFEKPKVTVYEDGAVVPKQLNPWYKRQLKKSNMRVPEVVRTVEINTLSTVTSQIPDNRTLKEKFPQAEIGYSPTRAISVKPRLSETEKITQALEDVRKVAHEEVDAAANDVAQKLDIEEEKDVDAIREELAIQFTKVLKAREKEAKAANA